MNTLLQALAGHAPDEPETIPRVYQLCADALRRRVLSEGDAELIACWFDRLAAGEDPGKVFIRARAGRPLGRTTKPRPDDTDIYWFVRWNLEAGHKPGATYRHVAKLCGLKDRTIANIYSKIKKAGGPA